MHKRLLALIGVLILPAALHAQSPGTCLRGKITDANGVPLPGAIIEIVGTGLWGISDDDGEYFIEKVPDREYSVTITARGYDSIMNSPIIRIRSCWPIQYHFEMSLSPEHQVPPVSGEEIINSGEEKPAVLK
ncbi:MAG: putative exported TonB-dependent receptor protein [Chlorobi bacterium]|nr:putative exported TonB-dependent receptor protein [Chlorobiota bacterium]